MNTIVGLCGSLRRASYNMMLLREAQAAAPAGTTIEIASIREVPLYDGDLDGADGPPAAVRELKDRVAASDGVLIITPEYNHSIPGVLKNTIDWLSRPPADIARIFRGRPVAIAGATTGQGGTALAQDAWLPVVRTLGMLPWFEGRLLVSGAAKVFDSSGALVDAPTREKIEKFVRGFCAFVERQKGSRP